MPGHPNTLCFRPKLESGTAYHLPKQMNLGAISLRKSHRYKAANRQTDTLDLQGQPKLAAQAAKAAVVRVG
jgi:hypothetical protein